LVVQLVGLFLPIHQFTYLFIRKYINFYLAKWQRIRSKRKRRQRQTGRQTYRNIYIYIYIYIYRFL